MVSVERDGLGRYVVRDGDKVLGRYRTAEMAAYRIRQLDRSRNPKGK